MGFAALVTGVAAWTIWGGDMFPQAEDPKGEPEKWTDEEMRRWLRSVSRLGGSGLTDRLIIMHSEI